MSDPQVFDMADWEANVHPSDKVVPLFQDGRRIGAIVVVYPPMSHLDQRLLGEVDQVVVLPRR